MLTKGAIGNLINRYKAVLKKCHLMNTFGSLAVASMIVLGGAGMAKATEYTRPIYGSTTYDSLYSNNGILSVEGDTYIYTFKSGDTLNTSSWGAISSFSDKKNMEINDINIFNDGSNDSSSYGIYVYNSNYDVSIGKGNVTNISEREGSSAVSDGIVLLSDESVLTKGDGDIVATTVLDVNSPDASAIANGVDVEWGGTAKLGAGDVTVNVTTTGSDDHSAIGRGFFVSGIEEGSAGDPVANLTTVTKDGGNIVVTVQSDSGAFKTDGVGIYGEGESDITIGKGNINIQVINTGEGRSSAAGIQLFDSGEITKGDGIIDVNVTGDTVDIKGVQVGVSDTDTATVNLGVMNITAVGTARTPGYNYVTGLDSTGNSTAINMMGGTLTVTAENGEATGISAVGGTINAGTTEDLSISVDSSKAIAVSAQGDTGNVVLGNKNGHVTITATGEGATGIQLVNEGTVTLKGYTVIDAQAYALLLSESPIYPVNNASLVNEGSLTIAHGTVNRYTGDYTQTSGSTDLGADSEFFGGDVAIEKGALTVNMADRGGVMMGDDQAMLALGQGISLNKGQTLVIGDVADAGVDSVAFGDNSLLVVDGSNNATPFITGSGKLSAAEGSRLYIANAKAGEVYTITEGLDTTEGEYWTSADLLSGRLIEAEITQNNDGDIVVDTKARDAATVLPGIIPVDSINTMVASNLNNINSDSMGIRFLSRALDETFLSPDSLATATVNEVSRAAVTAGVQNTALRLADAGVDQLTHHLSLSFFGKENSIHKDGVDIWASPMYGNTYTHGMVASGTSVRGNYGGMTLGADALVGEIMGGKVRVGAAINGGGGKSETRGTVTSTDNEYNFGGVNLYAGWNLDNLNLIASVGYAMANHDVKMNLPAAMGMGQAKADVDTNAFIADLRAEYQINTSVVDILPHAGVRYTALNTESHDLKVNGSTLNSVASDTQHIVQFPIGVTVTKDIDVSGWNVKPQFDVSVIPAAGEKKNTTKVSYTGIGSMDSVNTRIMDSTSWAGMVGVQAEKGNFALGLNYGIQASSHETDQGVRLTLGWKF